jgi:hypothetical protein
MSPRERVQPFGVRVALLCVLLAQVVDVGFVLMRVGDLPEGVGQVELRLV